MHVHQSLWRGERNAFFDADELSAVGRAYLGGLLNGIVELAPLGSPTALAYTRRSDGSFCPTAVSWGGDNRTIAVRVLVDGEGATRIEQRDAAADANPYLVLAGQICAGLSGIEASAEPPDAVVGSAYNRPDLPPLPRTLEAALAAFTGSALARTVLGVEAHASLCTVLGERVEAELTGLRPGPDKDGGW